MQQGGKPQGLAIDKQQDAYPIDEEHLRHMRKLTIASILLKDAMYFGYCSTLIADVAQRADNQCMTNQV